MPIAAGTKLDGYEILALLGSGGMGEEQRRDWTIRLESTLSDAQSAWDDYRKHLSEHGIVLSQK